MNCDKCKYYGGLVEDPTTYSGLKLVCNAPKNHFEKWHWCRVDGASLPGRHCGVPKEDVN